MGQDDLSEGQPETFYCPLCGRPVQFVVPRERKCPLGHRVKIQRIEIMGEPRTVHDDRPREG
jgi:hypothetical protein